jgi:hypothetical protein
MSTPQALATLTQCKLCGERFNAGVAIIGKPNARKEELLMQLGSHVNLKHPQQAQMLAIDGAAFMGMIFLMLFDSTDEEVTEEKDRTRWHIHQKTLIARFSDESLEEQCRALSRKLVDLVSRPDICTGTMVSREELLRSAFECILIDVFTGMRDVLEEPNRYPTEPQLVY